MFSGLIRSNYFQVMADPAPSHYVEMKTLIVTPSRKIFRHEIPVMSNRLIRSFPNESFLIVSFRDETLVKLQDVRCVIFLVNLVPFNFFIRTTTLPS
jgi:hypothetical protein